jgi:hypothetical protein
MSPEDTRPFLAALSRAAEYFNETLSESKGQIYFEGLKLLPLEAVLRGLAKAMEGARFMPKIVDVVEAIEGTRADRAEQAWTRFTTAAASAVGAYQSVDFEDPALHATIREMGGWAYSRAILDVDEDQLGFVKRDFLRHYDRFLRLGTGDNGHPLLGIQAIENRLTRPSWDHALDHVDEVLQIGPGGSLALPPVPAMAALPPALDPEPEAPLTPEENQARLRELIAGLAKPLPGDKMRRLDTRNGNDVSSAP